MQGALFRGGCAVAEKDFRDRPWRFKGEPTPASCQTPHLPAAADGQHLHSLSKSGPGQLYTESVQCSLFKLNAFC